MPEQFVTIALSEIQVGEPLPGTVYIYLDFRFITFRAEGDVIDRATFDRLEYKKVKNLFVNENDRPKFTAWTKARHEEQAAVPALPPEMKAFKASREDVHRKTMDIFQSSVTDKTVTQVLNSSKKLVQEVMKAPYAVSSLAQLQTYSQGTVDHSVNVSILSVYLAMQMGYSHAIILQHVGTGGLLHDIGKPKVDVEDDDAPDVIETKMKEHPSLGIKMFDAAEKIPNEVKMIIAQHHECYDGSGFPKKMRGSSIYDLARIVAIANVFDELVGDGKGTLLERQRAAITQMDQVHFRKFDPQKLEKALKILKMGV